MVFPGTSLNWFSSIKGHMRYATSGYISWLVVKPLLRYVLLFKKVHTPVFACEFYVSIIIIANSGPGVLTTYKNDLRSPSCLSLYFKLLTPVKPRVHDTTCCKPVAKPIWQPVKCLYTTRYNRLSIRLSNRYDNLLYRVYSRLSNWLYNSGCSFNTVVQPVVKRVW